MAEPLNSMRFEIIDGGIELLGIVERLWKNLNVYHMEKSRYFEEEFENFKFEERKTHLERKALNGRIYIELIRDRDKNGFVGYCVSSIENGTGEVDSLYIENDYRGLGFGRRFMEDSMKWMDSEKVERRQIGVVIGNDEAVEFYRKFGFFPHVMILRKKKK